MMSDEKQISKLLLKAVGCDNRMSPSRVVEQLYRRGLLDRASLERCVIKERVFVLCKGGMKRCEAMAKVADEQRCSYAKIRAIIYKSNN
jgi:hypothetical protein